MSPIGLTTEGRLLEPKPELKSTIRLTEQVKAGGCASKLAPGSLLPVLARLPKQVDPAVLVGYDKADDAGVYRIGPDLALDLALVQTIDFFTPLVDDPFTFGQIAATNALSDVYAMGGRPLTALCMVCFPQPGDLDVLEQIMCGGLAKMEEARCTVIGGHSVRDEEMKFGYAVTGLVDPAQVWSNAGAVVGDALLLTKPIGTGVITTALKQRRAQQAWIDGAVASMTTLNRRASDVARNFSVHAATDITGFGLMGHAREMALGSGVRLAFDIAAIPLLAGAMEAARLGAIPAGLLANRDYAECVVQEEGSGITDELRSLMYDPQTAGGLLLSVAPEDGNGLLHALQDAGLPAARVGEVLPSSADGRSRLIVLRAG